MRYAIILSSLLLGAALPANAQITITFGVPSQSIGMNMPFYPDFQRVPNYPVYYAPQANYNVFFYDGMYWAYQRDNWYASSWYNGPWGKVAPRYVPYYVLRVPVRYYRHPPKYFKGWSYDQPPRWGQYYGAQWEQERSGWNTWNRYSAPPPAPLPVYQRQYSGDRYPRYEQQPVIRTQYYQYKPSEPVVRQTYEQEAKHVKQSPPPKQQQAPQQQPHAPPQPQQQPHAPPQPQQQPHAPPQPQQQPHAQPQPQHQPTSQPQQQPHAQPQQQPKPQQQPHGQSQPPPQGAPAGGAQAPASGQEKAPQGKGGTKGSKSDQSQDDGTDKNDDKGQGHN
jgi:hypothetical protein